MARITGWWCTTQETRPTSADRAVVSRTRCSRSPTIRARERRTDGRVDEDDGRQWYASIPSTPPGWDRDRDVGGSSEFGELGAAGQRGPRSRLPARRRRVEQHHDECGWPHPDRGLGRPDQFERCGEE